MPSLSHILTAGALAAVATVATATPMRRQDEEFVGYLMTTFVDALPQVHWHLSQADDPFSFTALNGGEPVLVSDVGTGGVRDMFLTTNSERSEYFMLATGTLTRLDILEPANKRYQTWISECPTLTGMMREGMVVTAW